MKPTPPRLFVSYNEDGAPIRRKLARRAAAEGPVWQASMMELDPGKLPPGDGEVVVNPVFMQSGYAASVLLPARLKEAYALRGERPVLRLMPVWGASASLAEELVPLLSARLKPETALLVVAHGKRGGVQAEEPALFAERLAARMPAREVALAWFGAEPSAARALSSLRSPEVAALPFLAGKGMHYRNDMPAPEDARRFGKALILLPPVGDWLA